MTHFRKEKVESLIAHEVADILLKRVQDPRIRGVHVVSVNVSPDFGSARVYYSTLLATADIEVVQKGLDSAKAFIRSEVKKAIKLRAIPEIYFVFDPSIREGDRMIDLLSKIEKDKKPVSS